MVATCEIDERNGAVPGSPTSDVSNCNFGSGDTPDLTPSVYKIVAGENSYEKWWKMSFGGTFQVIDNLKVWKNAGVYVTGESVWSNARPTSYGGNETYTTPTQATSTKADVAIPTSEPAENLGIGGALGNSLNSPGDSDYLVMQLRTTVSTPAGAVNQKTFTFQWDEI